MNQIVGGIAISQVEIVRPADMGLGDGDLKPLFEGAAARLRGDGNTAQTRSRIAVLIADGDFGKLGLDDETLDAIRNQMRRFVDEKISPYAHDWHLKDQLIPMDLIDELSELGVFGLTVPEQSG
jgi:(2S)-methylsuccinyl-CoA dehydrogenase